MHDMNALCIDISHVYMNIRHIHIYTITSISMLLYTNHHIHVYIEGKLNPWAPQRELLVELLLPKLQLLHLLLQLHLLHPDAPRLRGGCRRDRFA